MTAIGNISLSGLFIEEFQFPFLLASGITEADEGKAVAIDTAAANTVKLAGNGDRIVGRLERVEDRETEGVLVGTVSLAGGLIFPVNPDATASSPDETPAVGDFLVGGTDDDSAKGYVQKAQTADLQAGKANWQVVEMRESNTKAVAIKV